MSRSNKRNAGWVVVVFENEHAQFPHEVAYVKGPFEQYEQAEDWASREPACTDGFWQITFLDTNTPNAT
jgi:hypothetical protein